MSFFKQRENKLFYKFLGSYFILILLVICMLWPVYIKTLETVKNKAVKDSYSVLSSGFNVLSFELQNINLSIQNLYREPNVKQLSMMGNQLELQDYYRLITAQRYFTNLFPLKDPILDCFILFQKNDIVLGRSRVFDKRDKFYGYFMSYSGSSHEQWLESILSTSPKGEFWAEQSVFLHGNGSEPTITYLLTLPYESTQYSDSVAVVLLSKQQILNLLGANDLANDSWVYLKDMKGDIFLQHNYSGDPVDVSGNGIKEIRINGVDTTIISLISLQSGIQLVAGIPDAVFIESVKPVRSLLILYFAIALLAGFILSIMFSYRQSKPWRKLIQYISSINDRESNNGNEHENIIRVFDELSRTKEQLFEKVSAQHDIVVAGMLERLLHNAIYSPAEYKMVRHYLSPFPDSYRLVVIRFFISMPSNDAGINPSEARELVRVLAMQIIRDVFGSQVRIHPTGKARIILIVPQHENNTEMQEYTEMMLAKARDTLYERCRATMSVGISRRHEGVESITTAYNEAQHVLRYRSNQLIEPIMWFDNMPPSKKGHPFRYESGQKLCQLLLAGEKQPVLNMLDELFKVNEQNSYVSDADLKQLFYNVRGVILQCIHVEMNMDHSSVRIPDYQETSTIQELLSDLRSICVWICDNVENRKQSHNTKLKDAILSFIKTNYARQELCGEFAAEKFGISVKYLFNFVKEQTGRTFGDHLEEMRLKTAMQLMRTSELSINQIALNVGFVSQNSFYKVFKRVYGVSPSIWRSSRSN